MISARFSFATNSFQIYFRFVQKFASDFRLIWRENFCWSLFLEKLQFSSLQLPWKRDFSSGFSQLQIQVFLTHFSPMSHFHTPWKPKCFLMFSGGIEMWHWTKISALKIFAKFREKRARYQDIFGNTVFKFEFGGGSSKAHNGDFWRII